MKYCVLVGNLGTVHQGVIKQKALDEFREYVKLSESGYGRASGEEVYLLGDDEIISHYPGNPNKKPVKVTQYTRKGRLIRPHTRRQPLKFTPRQGMMLPTITYKGKVYIVDTRLAELRDKATTLSIPMRQSESDLLEYILSKFSSSKRLDLIQSFMGDLEDQGNL